MTSDPSLHDEQLEEEIRLVGALVLAASQSPGRLPQAAIDGILGVGEGRTAAGEGWSAAGEGATASDVGAAASGEGSTAPGETPAGGDPPEYPPRAPGP